MTFLNNLQSWFHRHLSARKPMPTTLLDHMESFLGRTVGGWKDPGEKKWPFSILRFEGGPIAKTVTHCTLGFSNFPVPSKVSDKLIRLELMFMARSDVGDRNIPAILHDICKQSMDSDSALLRGEVIGPQGRLFAEFEMEALYVASPVYLPDDFGYFIKADGNVGAIAWLVPITRREAEFIFEQGWPKFEDRLLTINPDLLDFRRASIVV